MSVTASTGAPHPARRSTRTSPRRQAFAWHGGLFALLLPVLVLGFGASALANRLVFAGWGLLMTPLLVIALRRGFEAWRGLPGILLRVAPALAAGVALFAFLVDRHQEILDLGTRALLPGIYSPNLTRPETWGVLAILLALVAVGAGLVGRRSRHPRTERPERPMPESDRDR